MELRIFTCWKGLCASTLLMCAACSSDSSSASGNVTPAPAAGGGAQAIAGTAAGTSAGGTSASAGIGASGTGGQLATSGRGSVAAAGSSAGQSAASGAGGSSSSTAGASGMSSAGMSAAGSGGASGMPSTGCTRELLKSTVEMYFTALAAHDPKTLPLAENIKFTENGMVQEIGKAGLWQTAGMVKYHHSALDTENCSSVSESVVPDGTRDIPLGLRIKVAPNGRAAAS